MSSVKTRTWLGCVIGDIYFLGVRGTTKLCSLRSRSWCSLTSSAKLYHMKPYTLSCNILTLFLYFDGKKAELSNTYKHLYNLLLLIECTPEGGNITLLVGWYPRKPLCLYRVGEPRNGLGMAWESYHGLADSSVALLLPKGISRVRLQLQLWSQE